MTVRFDKTVNQYGEFYSYGDFLIQSEKHTGKYKISRDFGNVTNTNTIGYVTELSTAKKVVRLLVAG